MKKKFLLSLLTIFMVANCAFGQNQLVATLAHNGTTTFFYGSSALQAAHDAAENGDAIILSGGYFDAPVVTKALKIIGAGMGRQGDIANDSTVINGRLIIEDFSHPDYILLFEGLQFNSSFKSTGAILNTEFRKCKLDYWGPFGGEMGNGSDFSFVGCRITAFTCSTENVNINFINCMVNNPFPEYNSAVFHFENSIVCTPHNRMEWITSGMKYCTFNNCILFAANADYNKSLPVTVTVTNSIALHNDIFLNISDSSNVTTEFSGFFKTFQGDSTKSDNISYDLFELSDIAKETYRGDDGKEVGIYGGIAPYSISLSVPEITKSNVSKQAVDGKLSVNIEINGGE